MDHKKLISDFQEKLDFEFSKKPLLIGGSAMEYYKLRKTGADYDFVLSSSDHQKLKDRLDNEGMIYLEGKNHPGYEKTPEFVDLYGDHGLLVFDYEFWDSIVSFDYDYLSQDAIELEDYKVVSLKNLMFLKTFALEKKNNLKDVKLIAKKILDNIYGK